MASAPTLARPGAPAAAVSHRRAAVALALLLGLQSVSTDVYLPALPMLTRQLGARISQGQLTLSAMILAFGLAQLVWGPLADRVGRRPVLLIGLAAYTLASAGCLLAGSIDSLLAWRVLQGAALAAPVVCARAVLRDLYEPVQGAQVMALALSGLGVIALIGPLAGGVAAAALREAVDQTVHSARDVIRVMQVPVLAVLPALPQPLLLRRRSRLRKIAVVALLLLLASVVAALHYFYMPIDVAWYGLLRRLDH